MRVTIFGASGGIGRHVREQARANGHELTLFAREPSSLYPLAEGERVVVGDIGDAERVSEAVAGSEAVISAVGPTANSPDQVVLFESFAHALVKAMERHGVHRLVALSGAGVTAPKEQKRLPDRLVSAIVGRIVRHVVMAKQRELEIIAASSIEWVAPRPPRVNDGPATGIYKVGDHAIGPRSRISQADLAHFMVSQLTDDRHIRSAPFISS
ncbi:NAD(P)H-binding protein [soil metagenome]